MANNPEKSSDNKKKSFGPSYAQLNKVELASNYGPTNCTYICGVPCIDFTKNPSFNSMIPLQFEDDIGTLQEDGDLEQIELEDLRKFTESLCKKMFLMGQLSDEEINNAKLLGCHVNVKEAGDFTLQPVDADLKELNIKTSDHSSTEMSEASTSLSTMYARMAEIIYENAKNDSIIFLHQRNPYFESDDEVSLHDNDNVSSDEDGSLPPSISQVEVNVNAVSSKSSEQISNEDIRCEASPSSDNSSIKQYQVRKQRQQRKGPQKTFSNLIREIEERRKARGIENTQITPADLGPHRPLSFRADDIEYYHERISRLETANKNLRTELQSALNSARKVTDMALYISRQIKSPPAGIEGDSNLSQHLVVEGIKYVKPEFPNTLNTIKPREVGPSFIPSPNHANTTILKTMKFNEKSPKGKRPIAVQTPLISRDVKDRTAGFQLLKKPSVSQIPRPVHGIPSGHAINNDGRRRKVIIGEQNVSKGGIGKSSRRDVATTKTYKYSPK